MAVQHLWAASGPGEPERLELLRAAVLCNDAVLRAGDPPGSVGQPIGDPTEVRRPGRRCRPRPGPGRRAGARPAGRGVPLRQRPQADDDRAPDPDRVPAWPARAPRRCFWPAPSWTSRHRCWLAAIQQASASARQGLRVLAVAGGERGEVPSSQAAAETGLRLLGLIAVADPLRAQAPATIAAVRRAGIVPVLITGDHAATAAVIARRAGVLGPDRGGTGTPATRAPGPLPMRRWWPGRPRSRRSSSCAPDATRGTWWR